MTPLEADLLSVITSEELPGRAVRLEYEKRFNKRISYGVLYITLRRMTDAGLLLSRDEHSGGERARYFRKPS